MLINRPYQIYDEKLVLFNDKKYRFVDMPSVEWEEQSNITEEKKLIENLNTENYHKQARKSRKISRLSDSLEISLPKNPKILIINKDMYKVSSYNIFKQAIEYLVSKNCKIFIEDPFKNILKNVYSFDPSIINEIDLVITVGGNETVM